jgi:hypothetical protein
MKGLMAILLILTAGFRSDEGGIGMNEYWVVESNSRLKINGSSNISPFQCDVLRYLHNDTLRFSPDVRTHQLHFSQRSVTIDIAEIDCHHRYVTSDLRKTLKYQQYPHLKIHLIRMEDPSRTKPGQSLKGVVDIELGGHTKRIDIEYTLKSQTGRYFHLEGKRSLLFSDFKLEPPRKLAGLIRINEDLDVSVQLFFRRIG